MLARPAPAAILIWDGDTATSGLQDGGGTWNSTDSNRWYNGSSSTYQPWSNSNPDSAVFGVGSGTAGAVTLTSALTTSGVTFNAAGSGNYVLSGGTLILSRASTITANSSATIDSVLSGRAGVTVTGMGTLTLGGPSIYSGTTAVNAGSLLLDFTQGGAPAANIVNSTANNSDLALSGGTLAIQGQAGTTNSQRFNGLTVNPGDSAIVLSAAGSNSLSLACGPISRYAGGTVDFTLPAGEQTAGNGVSTTSSTSNGILGGYATVDGADWATVGSSGLILAYSGYTTFSGSSPSIANGPATNVRIDSGSTGNITLGAMVNRTASINTLLVSDPVARTIDVGAGNTLRLGMIGGILVPAGAGGLTIGLAGSAGILAASGTDTPAGEIVLINNSSNPIIVNSAIVNGAGSLTKAGPGALLLAGNIILGGTATISSGLLSLSGDNSASFGVVRVDGGTCNLGGTSRLSAPSEYVGYSGSGMFTQTGGTNNVGSNYGNVLFLAYNSRSDGSYSLSGSGVLSASTEYVGYSGTGTFNQSGGTNNVRNFSLYLGNNTGSNGSYSLSGSGVLLAPGEYVGSSGCGTFTQSGGTNNIGPDGLYLGNDPGPSGSYNLSGSGALSASYEVVGLAGTATFNQSGGTNNLGSSYGWLYLGYYAGSSGSYHLSGSGALSAYREVVGLSGTATFNQSGGTNNVGGSYDALYLGGNSGSSGSYSLSGSGVLSAFQEYVGSEGAGTFTQSGGTNNIGSGGLYIGDHPASNSSYTLSGSGVLSAFQEYVVSSGTGTGTFKQTGGSNSASYLNVSYRSRYQFSGGTLQISGGLANQGVFDGGGGTGGLSATQSILDFSAGTLQNTGSMSVSVGANSLVIVRAGFNPSTAFGSYTNLGLTHIVGTPLAILPGQGFSGIGAITDFVNCQGTISAAAGGWINLNGGVTVSGTGNANLGSGGMGVNDALSGITAGSLSAGYEYVGSFGTGAFTQSGGTNNVGYDSLYLGNYQGSNGSYNLSGSGALSASEEYVGSSGTGVLTQSGGMNKVAYLYLGNNPGSSGSYDLGGSGALLASTEYVGNCGIGTFVQSGGTNNLESNSYGNGLYLGYPGSSGSYNLSGSGALSALQEYVGNSGSGTFNQSGGTNTVKGMLSLSASGTYNLTGGALLVSGIQGTGTFNVGGGTLYANAQFSTSQGMTLTGDGNIDTDVYPVTLSGPLSGPGSLNKWGAGTLTLCGSNTYTGGTMVNAGTLLITDADALPDGTSLTVGDGGMFASNPSMAAVPEVVSPIAAAPGPVVASVPEPGTLALLSVAAIVAIAAAWRERKR